MDMRLSDEAFIKSIPSTTIFSEAMRLYGFIKEYVPANSTVVELGTGLGRCAVTMALAGKEKHIQIVTIDSFAESERYSKEVKKEWGLSQAQLNAVRCGVSDVITFHTGNSYDVPCFLNTLPETKLCFIDADHTYEGVVKDIRAWMPIIIANKGVLCGHDYWDGNPDGINVMRAVDEIVKPVAKTFSAEKRIWMAIF